MSDHELKIKATVSVKEGTISVTGDEVIFDFAPIRPRHIKLVAEIQSELKQLVSMVQHFNNENK